MHVLVICAVLLFATINAGPVSIETGLKTPVSSPVDKIARISSFIERGFGSIASILTSLEKRLGDVERAQSRVEDSISLIIKNYTAIGRVVDRLEFRTGLGCPVTWVKRRSLCYKFYKCRKDCSANDAKKFCEAQKATLASLKSAQLNAFVSSLVTDNTLAYYYAGARDELVEGEWRWADGSRAVYTNWAENEPNNIGGIEDCMIVLRRNRNTWNDALCYGKSKTGYVCEKRAT